MPDLDAYREWALTRAFAKRVDGAREILREAALRGRVVIATSWGKDSVALSDLALDTLGRIPLMHIASAYRMPGWEHVRDHFAARTIVHEIAPSRTLAEMIAWCEAIGLPHERTRSTQAAAVVALKKDPGRTWVRENGYNVQFLGLRAVESKGRKARLRRGTIYDVDRGAVAIACPLAWWDARDVWAWIVHRGLPYHQMYDCETHGLTRETIRNTGWLSTDGAQDGRVAWLRAHYPDQYRLLEREFPRVGSLL